MGRPWSDLEALVEAVEGRATHLESVVHGPAHWRAVGATAAELADAATAGAHGGPDAAPDRESLFLFALLHDAMREDDGRDLEHGPRAAVLLEALLADRALRLPGPRAAQLHGALADHTRGDLSTDPTVACCWDADRLLIHRVGFVPHPRFCSTIEGRRRADAGELPELVGPSTWAAVAARLGVD